MTLLEAFRCVGPVLGASPEEDRQRNEAAVVLDAALRARWRYVRFPEHILKDATQTVLSRLVTSGPRGIRDGDPTDDQGVGAFLQRALTNAAIDEKRRRGRSGDPPPQSPPDGPDREAEAREALEAALGQPSSLLLGTVIPAAVEAMEPDEAERFRKTLDELVAIARGDKRFEDVVTEEEAASPEAHGGPKAARARLYTRYSRWFKATTAAVNGLVGESSVNEAQREGVLRVLNLLRLSQRS